MDQLSIRIKIADREYPMKVKPEDEEHVRMAGKIINERIKSYKEQFGIDDKQDLLAMVAFDSLVDKLQADGEKAIISEDVYAKVNELNALVSSYL